MNDSSPVPNSVFVAGAGLCCAVGYQLDAAVCAIRANMDHFQESSFNSLSSDPVNVARLPQDIFGQERIHRWIEYAVRDCAQRMEDPESLLDGRRTAIIFLGPDPARPYSDSINYAQVLHDVLHALGDEGFYGLPPAGSSPRPHAIHMIAQGRTGLAEGLLQAARLLVNAEAEQVLIVGGDSYLYAADINAYLQDNRLIVRGNSNGFIPGEAAAVVLLRRGMSTDVGLHISGVGMAQENGRQDGSVPSRGQGLTTAIRDALKQARLTPRQIEFRISDQNGEQFFAREAANAITRIMFGEHKLAQLTLSDKLGEIGAASGPAMLAWLMRDMADATLSPGNVGLVHLASDSGARCAVALRYQGE
ncbi:hypothetical protein [Massilia genomosp. 1]|uniref:3-oxoacyl-ACP synthase n=1 Tax=Massilia genomosp. 1 TaxID=2609280 RepID=A0ABX0MWY8_9BURK|nr:hypothetical protein [Massilia genomosp. 1]NHZ67001.1 hypothetical protein [Massilia genomosp. 1]